jgi:hypothetical protein
MSVPFLLLQPMLATTGQPAHDQEAWSLEVKWDGWRAVVYVDEGLKVRTRTGRPVSDSLLELTGLVGALANGWYEGDGDTLYESASSPGSSRELQVSSFARARRLVTNGSLSIWICTRPSQRPPVRNRREFDLSFVRNSTSIDGALGQLR